MAKKKDGLARPERYRVMVEGGVKGDKKSFNDDLDEAITRAVKQLDHTPSLRKVRTENVRILAQSGRLFNARRTTGRILRRTFIFE